MHPEATPGAAYALAASLVICFGGSAHAATVNWKPGTVGNYDAPANWDTGVVPAAADTAKIDNSGNNPGGSTVNFLPADNFSVATLDVGASNLANNKPLFNQTGGTLSVGTLFLGHPGYGASKSPSYNLSGGTLNISSALTYGNGQGISLNLSSTGVLNFTGGSLVVGSGGGINTLSLADSAVFNYNSSGQITVGGGNVASVGHVVLANNSAFTANSVTTILTGNDGSGGNTVDLSGNAVFSAPLATMALAQWNNGSNVTPAIPATTLTLADTSLLTVTTLKLGGNNLGNPQYSIVALNGGTLQAGSVVIGSSTTPSDSSHNAVHCSGIVKAVPDGGNGNFFSGSWVDIGSGGLKFDTDGNDVGIPQILHHDPVLATTLDGGLEKRGDGVLTLDGFNTYTGPTVVTKGELDLSTDCLADSASVTVKDGAVLNLSHGLNDRVASLTLGSTVHSSGVWGSSSSGAPNIDDVHLAGTGRIQIGASTYVPKQLIWSGAIDNSWDAGITANFVTSPATGAQAFQTFDNVTFPDPATPGETSVLIYGSVQPGSMTFNNTGANDYVLDGTFAGIGGTGGVTKNGSGDVTLGGDTSTYTGPVVVNAGRLIAGGTKAFGNSSGITIADGAQIDINGSGPGAIYTYTVGGTGPGGAGIIVNSGGARFADGGIRDLVLTADTTIGNDGSRFDIGAGGVVTGNGHTLTKIGANDMAFRGDASATPIQVIIAGGSVWAETNGTAFGGATGSVTVKSGARVGTYGSVTVNTPVTIQDGGSIYNQGAALGTWTGNVTLQGAATLNAGNEAITVTGNFSGTGSVTTTGSHPITLSSPAYAGDTNVTQGNLILSAVNPNDDGKSVHIEIGALLSLPHGAVDTVKTLFLGGVQVVAGTYGSTSNGAVAAGFRTPLIDGPGTLRVTDSPGSSGGNYGTWADANITNPAYSALKGRDDDPDKDGLSNFNEYLFGSDPQNSSGSAVKISTAGGALVLVWNQRQSGPVYVVQQSATLGSDWITATDIIPAAAVDQTGVPSGYTRQQATVPATGARRFLRVSGSED